MTAIRDLLTEHDLRALAAVYGDSRLAPSAESVTLAV
jgi:hypothetical protein